MSLSIEEFKELHKITVIEDLIEEFEQRGLSSYDLEEKLKELQKENGNY